MKTMIHTLAYTALLSIALSSCNDDNAPILTQKDWDNTATYFKPTDENMFGTYYKPQLGYVGDPMPFYDPQAGDFNHLPPFLGGKHQKRRKLHLIG